MCLHRQTDSLKCIYLQEGASNSASFKCWTLVARSTHSACNPRGYERLMSPRMRCVRTCSHLYLVVVAVAHTRGMRSRLIPYEGCALFSQPPPFAKRHVGINWPSSRRGRRFSSLGRHLLFSALIRAND